MRGDHDATLALKDGVIDAWIETYNEQVGKVASLENTVALQDGLRDAWIESYNEQVGKVADLAEELASKDGHLAEMQSDYRSAIDQRDVAMAERDILYLDRQERDERISRLRDKTIEIEGERDAAQGERNVLLGRFEEIVYALGLDLDASDQEHIIEAIQGRDERIKELEADGGKSELRKQRDKLKGELSEAMARIRQLGAELAGASKNDQRDEKGRFVKAD